MYLLGTKEGKKPAYYESHPQNCPNIIGWLQEGKTEVSIEEVYAAKCGLKELACILVYTARYAAGKAEREREELKARREQGRLARDKAFKERFWKRSGDRKKRD